MEVPVVFDIDGTIADTEPLVRRAYRAAGVIMPNDVFGKSWRTWLPEMVDDPEEVHSLKQSWLIHFIRREGVRRLPACEALNLLLAFDQPAYLVTNSNERIARSIIMSLQLVKKPQVLGYGVPPRERTNVLSVLGDRGVYVDDRLETCAIIDALLDGWGTVHVTTQTKKELWTEIPKALPQLASLPAI